jgi:DNA polymerase III subunit beta
MTKFTITTKEIKSAINLASQFTSPNSPLPIMSNILFTLGGLIAGDGAAQIKIDAPVEGEFSVQADRIKKIVSSFADDAELTFEVKDKLTVKSGRSKLSMSILSSRDFPIPKFEGAPIILSMKQEDIKRHIENVIHAMPKDMVQIWMNAICFRGDSAIAIAGSHLSVSVGDAIESEFAIPAKYANQVAKLMSSGLTDVHVYENKIVFNLGDVTFICPKLTVKYPDVLTAVPPIKNPFIYFDKDEFLKASARAAINASKSMGAKIVVSNNEMTITCKDFDASADDSLEVKYEGPDFEFGYNIEQMRAAVSAINSEEILCHVGGKITGTMLFMSPDQMQKCVISPMRI